MADFPANKRGGSGDGLLAFIGFVIIACWVVGAIMAITGLVQHDPWLLAWGMLIAFVPTIVGKLVR